MRTYVTVCHGQVSKVCFAMSWPGAKWSKKKLFQGKTILSVAVPPSSSSMTYVQIFQLKKGK